MATICEQPELACTYAALILNDDGAAVTVSVIELFLFGFVCSFFSLMIVISEI